MSLIIGIDPGQTGAIAVVNNRGELVTVHDMPTVDRHVAPVLLVDLIGGIARATWECVAVIERVHSMPRQGVSSSFKFGMSYGIVLGVVAGHHLQTIHVTPTTWKKEMKVTADKETSRRKALDRWPAQAHLFARKMDNGRAEAALMALWHVEQLGQGAA